MRRLSYRNVKNTLVYTQLTNLAKTNTFPKLAWTLEEVCKLLETWFEYVCEIGGAKIFRKRKWPLGPYGVVKTYVGGAGSGI